MCSRYCLVSPHGAVRAAFGYRNDERFPPRYNIAPTQPVAVVRLDHAGERELALVRWGLIPSWVKDPSTLSLMINARAETAAEKTSFRGPMRHRRCLVPADGFYAWVGAAGERRPHVLRPRGVRPIAFAGLWDHWLGADGSEIETMAILTVPATGAIRHVTDRMPVVVAPHHHAQWLDVRPGLSQPAEAILAAAVDGDEDGFEAFPVDPIVNDLRRDDAELRDAISEALP